MKIFHVLLLLLSCTSLSAQDQLIPKAKLLKDLDQFEKFLLNIHPGLNHYSSTSDMPVLFDKMAESLPDAMNRIDFLKHLNPIIDSVKCGHTSFFVDIGKKILGKKTKELTGLFPLNLRKVEGKIIIANNLSTDTLNLNDGDQLLAINGLPIDAIIETLTNLSIGSDTDNQSGEVYYALRGFTLAYRMFYNEQSFFDLKIKSRTKGSIKKIKVPSQSFAGIQKVFAERYKPKKSTPFEFRRIEGMESTAILDINTFINTRWDIQQFGYRHKIKKLFKQINDLDIDYLIIDLRGNGGGAILNLNLLLRLVHTAPFVPIKEASINPNYYKSKASFLQKLGMKLFKKTKKKHSDRIVLRSFTEKQFRNKKRHGFKGKIVLLINEGTFSAAAGFALSLKSSERAVLLGTESGGSYRIVSGGNFEFVRLKNSKLAIRIPTILMEYNVDANKQSPSHGILPDVNIEQNISDILNNVDTQMEAAIGLIQKFQQRSRR